MKKEAYFTNEEAAVGGSGIQSTSHAPRAPLAPYKTRRIIGRVFFVILFALTVALIISATPLFSISDIEVNGNSYYSSGAIISKSGLSIGQNGFSALIGGNVFKALALRCSPAEQSIASACPYIKTIQARYVLPRTIRIDLEERNAAFVVPYFGSGLLIDGEGVVVDIVRDYRQSELPLAQGLPIERYDIGKALATGAEMGVGAVLSVINTIKQAGRDSDEIKAWDVNAIDVGDLRNITVSVNNSIDINFGDGTELYYRVNAAEEIMEHGIEEGETGLIIFSNGARPVFVPAPNKTSGGVLWEN